MKWYTCCNEKGLELTGECLVAAAHSCLALTDLRPHLVYQGRPNAITDYLARLGVTVIFHELSFAGSIRRAPDRPRFDRDWAMGTFLRFDLPLIERDDPLILYTDTDVVFAAAPDLPASIPGVLAAADEYLLEGEEARVAPEAFNAGILVLNLRVMRPLQGAIVDFTTARDFEPGSQAWYDQGVLNALFRAHRTGLPQALNWRPFGRPEGEPQIVHFQMLKPADIRRLAGSAPGELEPDLEANRRWWSAAADHYGRALAVLERHVSAEGRAALAAFEARGRG